MCHKYEPTLPGNPYRLTVRQHVISPASLTRFTASGLAGIPGYDGKQWQVETTEVFAGA
jgi:hypothetical protein